MAQLIIIGTVCGSVFINGGFFSVCENESITIPLNNENTVINFFPFDGEYIPCCFNITKKPRISGGKSELHKWNDGFFELIIKPNIISENIPPILSRQTMWGKGFAGICGGFFCTEFDSITKYYDFPIETFRILSENYALLNKENSIIVVNKNCEEIFKTDNVLNFNVEKNLLVIEFCPGNMNYFTVRQNYETTKMNLIKSEISVLNVSSVFEKITCFCQAVRLNMENEAKNFITPQLKEEMSFSSVRDFLGNFDETSIVKYGKTKENSIALRYKTDSQNYVYCVFSFSLKDGLIDDIEQV